MATAQTTVSDMLITVKSREIQRGQLAEMRADFSSASRHLLAAAHLELVLADDYLQAGHNDLALRSRLSAASCFWRAGRVDHARQMLENLVQEHPNQTATIQQVRADLESNPTNLAS
jgi:hypothetical protein